MRSRCVSRACLWGLLFSFAATRLARQAPPAHRALFVLSPRQDYMRDLLSRAIRAREIRHAVRLSAAGRAPCPFAPWTAPHPFVVPYAQGYGPRAEQADNPRIVLSIMHQQVGRLPLATAPAHRAACAFGVLIRFPIFKCRPQTYRTALPTTEGLTPSAARSARTPSGACRGGATALLPILAQSGCLGRARARGFGSLALLPPPVPSLLHSR